MWQEENYENIYEGDVQYSKQQVSIPSNAGAVIQSNSGRTGTGANGNDLTSAHHHSTSKGRLQNSGKSLPRKFFPIIVGMLIIITIAIIGSLGTTLAVLKQLPKVEMKNQIHSPSPSNNSVSLPNEQRSMQTVTSNISCLDLRNNEIVKNGVYKLATKVKDYHIDAFCDMETDGGGWTLVASVNENDINEKCGPKDRWATYVSPGFIGTFVKTTWDSKVTFGKPIHCLKDDYKNRAYHELTAKDIMIWHVPSGSTIDDMKDRSILRYRTSNQFLESEGGNLYGLFNYRYPLTKIERSGKTLGKRSTRRVLDALQGTSATLKSKIQYWYEYSYTGSSGEDRITNSSLYSRYGNKVYFRTRDRSQGSLNYEKEYEFTKQSFFVNTKRSQPFIMATAIANTGGSSSDYFETRIRSDLERSYQNELIKNNLTLRNFQLRYRAVQYHRSSYPSICEFHFIIFNTKEWGSLPPKHIRLRHIHIIWINYHSEFSVEGNARNFVMGYLLLTRRAGKSKITKTETDAVARAVLDAISPLVDLFNEDDGLSTPITYDKGSSSAILNMVPPTYRPYIEPGYIQFRAYNLTGYPSAVCPGMRMKSPNPEYMCIGGISGDIREINGTCGDFAGWAGKEGDVIQPQSSVGHAHSRSDISSTILIFYR